MATVTSGPTSCTNSARKTRTVDRDRFHRSDFYCCPGSGSLQCPPRTGVSLKVGPEPRGASEGALVGRAYLKRANLKGAHLEGANFDGSHLEEADLKGAFLDDADFTGAHLRGTDFTGAHFNARTTFTDAHIEGAVGLPPTITS